MSLRHAPSGRHVRSILVALSGFLALALMPFPVHADGPRAQVVRPAVAVATSTPVRRAGEPVFVEWGGSMWRATVLKPLADGRAVIHYEGWGAEWDELVTPARMRGVLREGAVRADDSVFVEWHGSYWPATVLRVTDEGYAIHYTGYGPEWDEVVSRSRITKLGN